MLRSAAGTRSLEIFTDDERGEACSLRRGDCQVKELNFDPGEAAWLISDPKERRDAEVALVRYRESVEVLSRTGQTDTIEYANDLMWCVRLCADLDKFDEGLPIAGDLISLLSSNDKYPLGMLRESYQYLSMYAYLLRRSNRTAEALTLDLRVQEWFGNHRDAFDRDYMLSVIQVSGGYAQLNDFNSAIAVLKKEIEYQKETVKGPRGSGELAKLLALSRRYKRMSKMRNH